jgi:nickel-dependent lactate racemase
MTQIELRTGVWYDDRPVTLEFPASWDVVTHWPDTPPPLSDDQIDAVIAAPVGQPPLRELARGKQRPVIIVDDLSRPTPVSRLMPFMLRELLTAGIAAGNVRVVVATGTHGKQDRALLVKKLGREVFDSCRVITHHHTGRTRLIGTTSFGTPVHVNRHVLDSDMLIGVGGVYPQHTTGFGGGAKLALGVLGIKSIASLHFGHSGVDGSYNVDNTFRHDVAEIARMIGLHTMFTLHIDANQQVVNIVCGDHFTYYDSVVEFARTRYDAPTPGVADVVIANAYPADSSVFFMRKAMTPIDRASPTATTVMIASNHGGLGHHGLYYPTHSSRLNAYRLRLTRASLMERRVLLGKIWRRLSRRPSTRGEIKHVAPTSPQPKQKHLWVYAPPGGFVGNGVDGMTITDSWERVVGEMTRGRSERPLSVRVYPCSSLQCIGKEAVVER